MPDTSGISSGTQNPYATPNYGGASRNSGTSESDSANKTKKAGEESASTNPYETQAYSHASTDLNTLTITDYFKLLAAQLANQDMSNPMSNSEMMAQMVQMAMVQSMTSMNDVMENVIYTLENSQIISTQTYAAGLVGQEVTVSVTEKVTDPETGEETLKVVGSKTGVVESVNFTSATPTFRLEGDDTDYPITYLLGMGKVEVKIPDPDEGEGDDDQKPGGVEGEGDKDKPEGTEGEGDKTEGTGGTESKPDGTDSAQGTENTGSGTENAGGTGTENTGSAGDAAADAENAAGTGAVDASGAVNTQPSASETEDENTSEHTEELGIAV